MEILLNEKLILPFLSTLGAALTIILMQFIARRVKETKQKIYAINYICDVSFRIISSEFFLTRHTIKPHIVATERIVEGDDELLVKTFLSNEFDILTAGSPGFSHLPNEYSLQIGYDDIKLVQMFDALLYLHKNETNRLSLNSFVKDNLKSMESFLSKTEDKQKDILYTYHDYLTSLGHESNRAILFISKSILPVMKDYLATYQFWLYSTKNAKNTIELIERQINENLDLVPENDYMEKVKNGGIQGEF
jgi:hypothetical protein